MREILFRGKQINNGCWIDGSLLIDETGRCYIGQTIFNKPSSCYTFAGGRQNGKTLTRFMGIGMVMVFPETIGQYTGLTVPSGKIFEHDIVTAKFKSNGARFNFTVKYSNEKSCYVFDNGRIQVPFCDIRSVRIIGNIHDNPELLKGGAG